MIPYIINAGLILAGCFVFYKLLLQKETFYRLNRYMLIACLLVSFSLPLVKVPQQWSLRKGEATLVQDIQQPLSDVQTNEVASQPAGTLSGSQAKPETSTNTFSLQQAMTWLVYLYWFGVLVFGINFLAQIVVLLYRAYKNPVIVDGQFRIVEVSGDKAPCSFGNNIFINPEKYEWETYNQILLHEKIHIQQNHSLDILIAEFMLIFQWFNPFAWQYRREVENNLEFLTDDQLVHHNEIEKASYQMSLLKVSTPHFPLSLTTNYNQSLLKKRIVMMNAKKSNVHTAWKYFFLLPLLVVFACLFNEPVANAQSDRESRNEEGIKKIKRNGIETEGVWFATIKNDKVSIQFKRDNEDDGNSFNGSTFLLSEFPSLPQGKTGEFSLNREAGTMQFIGKFEGNEGMGRYTFTPNRQYADYMEDEGVGKLDDFDLMAFFFINVKKSYLQMLKDQGFTNIRKNDLMPMAALKVDREFIRSIRENGYKNASMQNLITLKALKIDDDYINEIRGAGYKDISLQQLITFKAQGIDKNYLMKVQKARKSTAGNDDEDNNRDRSLSADEVVTLKALKIDDEYVNSFREVGYTNLSHNDIVSMKSVGVTPDFIKDMQDMGYRNLSPNSLVSMKALNITHDFVKGFEDIGYSNISPQDIVAMKAQHITPDYIRSFEAVGFKNIPVSQIIAVKAMRITPDYINSMKEKGFNYNNLNKYVQLKSITD